ncbi:uncharacterized protein METZ01_LOCUS341984, partial [marine metagenome]
GGGAHGRGCRDKGWQEGGHEEAFSAQLRPHRNGDDKKRLAPGDQRAWRHQLRRAGAQTATSDAGRSRSHPRPCGAPQVPGGRGDPLRRGRSGEGQRRGIQGFYRYCAGSHPREAAPQDHGEHFRSWDSCRTRRAPGGSCRRHGHNRL